MRARGHQPPRAVLWPTRLRRRLLQVLLVFVASVLMSDALVGERGLLETRRARRETAALAGELARLRQENARLREEARRLREDPGAIEELARADLGLIRPGEVLFIVKDVPQGGVRAR